MSNALTKKFTQGEMAVVATGTLITAASDLRYLIPILLGTAAVVALKYPLVGLGICICCLIGYLRPEPPWDP